MARSKRTLTGPFRLRWNTLWAHSTVSKLYTNARAASHWPNGRSWPRKWSRHRVTIYFWADFWCLSVDSVFVLWFYKRFNFNESYFTIHPFFALKIADAIILYAYEVLKIFNRHLNHKHEFAIIIGKTLHDHFWYPEWKLDTLFSIMYSWY